jgi:SAM-dependent methyltransferase
MSKHWFGPGKGSGGITSPGRGHPIMYGKPRMPIHFESFPDGGGYPFGFLEWAFNIMEVTDYSRVLHVCSGSVTTGIRIDIRRSRRPSVIADALALPFRNESFDWVLCDPPYSQDYAATLYGTGERYPAPGTVIRECGRVLRPGGLCGILHFVVPLARKPMELVNVWGVTTGVGYAIRAWSLFRKEEED